MDRKRIWMVLAVVVVLLVPVSLTSAQGPAPLGSSAAGENAGTAFTYQGQLKNGSGAVNGVCDFQFSLYAAASGGNQIGATQTALNVNVTNGLFSTPIDFGTDAFTGDARWLGIAVRCPAGSGSYTALNPLQPLTPEPLALALPGVYTQQNATSPNVIGGYSGNVISPTVVGGTIGGGGYADFVNRVSADYSTISGGNANIASGVGDTVGGGAGNIVSQTLSTVGGGFYNTAGSNFATVGGGNHNTAGYTNATVGGGNTNTASSYNSTVSGGTGNVASSDSATVGGGDTNTASGYESTVGGGYQNTSSGYGAAVDGGEHNTASAEDATIAGGFGNTADGQGSFVGGGGYDGSNSGGNQASGIASTIGGGLGNTIPITGVGAFIGGGYSNVASGNTAAVGAGYSNIAGGSHAAIVGGKYNSAGNYASVGGGDTNNASGDSATIGGGWNNTAIGGQSTVGGGYGNTTSGASATVPGGASNTASGAYSFAAGFRAKANANGNFTFADSNNFDFASSTANSFRVRATGGVRFVLGIDGSGATTWSCVVLNGDGGWSCGSDRNLKENFVAVDSRTILDRLAQVPILYWNAKGVDPSVKHLGPMAQDFYAAFGLGNDDKTISTIDLDGVALSSIQGLYEMSKQKDAQIAAQQQKIDDLESRVTALEQLAQANGAGAHADNRWSIAALAAAALLGVVIVRRPRQGGAQ